MRLLHQPASRFFFYAVLLGVFGSTPSVRAQLTVNPSQLSFGKVVIGQASSAKAALHNTGSATVTVTAMATTNSGYALGHLKLPLSLPPGGRAVFTLTFTPSAAGGIAATAKFRSNAPNQIVSLPVSGIGVKPWSMIANPPSLTFGKVPTGSKVALPLALTNHGNSAVTISQDKTLGEDFRVSGLTLPMHLLPGHSVTVQVSFEPAELGKANGQILVTNPTNPTLRVPLSGVGTPPGNLLVAPQTFSFGHVSELIGKTLPGVLQAEGSSVTIYAAKSSNSQYVLSGLAFPLTLAAGTSQPFQVIFTPTDMGPVPAQLSFHSNSAHTRVTTALTGIGTKFYNVSLSWNASTSPVVGYNIFRKEQNQSGTFGKFMKLNVMLDPLTTYVDSTVVSGQTYIYATTAVNAKGQHSVLSNEVLVTIP